MSQPPPMTPQLSPEELAKDQGPGLLGLFIFLSVLPLITVALRVVARRLTRLKLLADDWLLVPAMLIGFVQLAFLIEAIKHGLGKHIAAIDARRNIGPYLMYTYFSELQYPVAITLIRLSVLSLYLRIFSVNKMFRRLCYGMMAFVLAWGIGVFFTAFFQCSPIRAAWDKTIPGAKCFDAADFVIGSSVPNVVADFIIITLPMPDLWKLQMPLRRKLGLMVLFLVATLATVVAVLRCYLNAHISYSDPTWNFVSVAVLSTVETSVAICCACMPIIYPVFGLLIGKRMNPATRSNRPDNTAGSGFSAPASQNRRRLHSQVRGSKEDLWQDSRSDQPYGNIPLNKIAVRHDYDVEYSNES